MIAKPASAQKPGVELGVNLVGFSMINPDGAGNNITVFKLGSATFGGIGIGIGAGSGVKRESVPGSK